MILTIVIGNGANQHVFGVYTYNNGQASKAHTQRCSHVADGIDVWWIVKTGYDASWWCDSGSIEDFRLS